MKILFIGEYSNVFTELSKELKSRGHETFCISDGDNFKKYPADYLFINEIKETKSVIYKSLRQLNHRLGLSGISDFLKRWRKVKHLFAGYDVVQLINPVALTGYGSIPNLIMLHYVRKHNKAIYMSVLGDDYYVIEWFKHNKRTANYYNADFFTKYIKPDVRTRYSRCLFYKTLNDYAVKISKAIIPGLACYKHAYDWCNKTTSIVPFPLTSQKVGKPFHLSGDEKIVIFHGWQKGKEARKGNDVYDEVIKKVVSDHKDKVEYVIVQSVPFEEYVRLFNNCHIYIDQLYFPEYGYNALLGMAAGKVVFSCYNESYLSEFPTYSGEKIGICANMDPETLYNQFCEVINDISLMNTISKNAIEYVKNNHLSEVVTDLYLSIWQG